MVDPKSGNFDNLLHIGPGNIESFSGRILDNVNTVREDNLISGKFHFEPNDIIYGKINPQLAKYAHVNFEGLASADAYVLKAKNGVVQDFLYVILQTSVFYKYSVSVSMRTGMPKINRDELNQFYYTVPKGIQEQQKIGTFFTQLDKTIALHLRKLESFQQLKKGFLQKVFPEKQEKVSQIRFAHFQEEWEQLKLGNLIEQVIREVPKPDTPYERLSVRSHAKGTFHQHVDDPSTIAMEKLYIVRKNDLIVNITFAWEHAIAVANEFDDGLLVSHRFPMYRADGKSDIKFLHYMVSQEEFRQKLELISPGGAGRNRVLSKKDFLKIEVVVPKETEEQKRIGTFFNELDKTIILHQNKLEKLKQIKKSLLQKMFL